MNTASTTLSTTLGFGFSELLEFLTAQLLFVIGLGLALFQYMLPYIAGLVLIGAIVYFVYRAFRFFRH